MNEPLSEQPQASSSTAPTASIRSSSSSIAAQRPVNAQDSHAQGGQAPDISHQPRQATRRKDGVDEIDPRAEAPDASAAEVMAASDASFEALPTSSDTPTHTTQDPEGTTTLLALAGQEPATMLTVADHATAPAPVAPLGASNGINAWTTVGGIVGGAVLYSAISSGSSSQTPVPVPAPSPAAATLNTPSISHASGSHQLSVAVSFTHAVIGDQITFELVTTGGQVLETSAHPLTAADVVAGQVTQFLGSTTLTDGSYVIRTSLTHAGSTTVATSSPNVNYTLDTVAPVAPAGVGLVNDTGLSASDAISSAISLKAPTNLEIGATLSYSMDNGATWTPGFTAPTTDGTYTVLVRQTDTSGNQSVATPLSFTLDRVAPTAPTLSLQSDTGLLTTDFLTKDGRILFSAEAGALVEYSTNGGATWTSQTTTPFVAQEGLNQVLLRQTDVAGNPSAASTPLNFTLDTTLLTPTIQLAHDTGVVGDGLTDIGTVTLGNIDPTARVDYSLDRGVTWVPSFTPHAGLNEVLVRQIDAAGNIATSTQLNFALSGTSAAPAVHLLNDTGSSATDLLTRDATLQVATSVGRTAAYSADNGQTWATSFVPSQGANTILVREADMAGNISQTTPFNFTYDSVAPAAPTVALLNDTGIPGDKITSIGTLSFGTSLEAGASVEYSIDGGTMWSPTFTAATGNNTVLVRQLDAAGNASAAAAPFTFILQGTTPQPGVTLANDTGTLATDLLTSDPTLNVTGQPGFAVQYSLDNAQTWSVPPVPSGLVTLPTASLVQGANTVLVRQVDPTNGSASASTSLNFTWDNVAPSAPVPGAVTYTPANPVPLSVAVPLPAGSAVGDVITLTLTGSQAGNSQTVTSLPLSSADLSAGVIHLSAGTTLSADTLSLSATSLDLAGNRSTLGQSASSFTFDPIAPAAPATPTVSYTPGTANPLHISVGLPVVTGATAPALGDVLSLTLTGTGANAAPQTLQSLPLTLADLSAGSVSFVPTGLANDTYLIRATLTDAAGNVSQSSVAQSYVLDTVAPAQPTLALVADTGINGVNTDSITSNGVFQAAGLEAGATVEYSTGALDANGALIWSTTVPTAVEGLNTISVRQTDVAGNVSVASTVLNFTLDTLAPAAPTLALVADTGIVGDGITSNGALQAPGNLEAGTTVEYSTGALDANGALIWSTTLPTAAEGANTISVRQTDAAGNVSVASTVLNFTLDTVAPTAPNALSLVTDSGVVGDSITNNGALQLPGNLEANATVEYSTGALDANGALIWSTAVPTVAEGPNTLAIRQIDLAGNVSAASAPLSFTLDTIAPTAPSLFQFGTTTPIDTTTVTNSALEIAGVEAGASVQYEVYVTANGPTGVLSSLAPNATTGTYLLPSQALNNNYSVNVVVTDVAGNATSTTVSYTLAGTASPTVVLTNDTGLSNADTITFDPTLSITQVDPALTQPEYSLDGLNGWSTTLPTWTQGLNTVYVRSADPAATLAPSLPSLFQFTLDTVAPATPTLSLVTDSGIAGDGITNNGAIQTTGLEAGTTVEYSDGTTDPITGALIWSTTAPPPVEGPNTVYIRQTDVAGNISISPVMPGTPDLSFTLDTLAPATPGAVLTLDSGTPGDGLTNSAAITLSSVEVGALVEYIAYPTGTAAPTVWTTATLVTNQFTPIDTVTGLPLAQATPYTVQIRQTDVAGNVSLTTQSVTLTLDTLAPATPGVALTLDSGTPGDGLTNLASVNVTGLEPGAIVEYISYIAGTPAPTTWRAVTPDALGNFVPTDAANAALADGVNYTVEVRQTDMAGNLSGTTGSVNFMLDTVAPTQPAAPNVTPAAGTNPTTLSVAVPANAIAGDVLSLVLTDAANTVITPTGTVALTAANLGGNVTFTLAAGLANGSYGATAQLTDLAGNASTASAAGSFAVGGTLPAAATITMVSDTGISTVDHISSNAALNIGINAAATNVSYVLDGVTVPSYVAPTVDGPHTLTISGTGVVPVTFNFTLDRAALAPTLTLATDTGLYANDHISSSGLINVTGLDPNIYQVSYSIAPVVAGVVGQSSAGTITVTNGTAQIPAPTGDGIYQVTAQQLDKAGNSSTGTTLTYTLDTGALTPVLTLTDNLATPGTPQPLQGSTITSASLTPSAGGIETGAILEYSLTGQSGSWADLATFTPILGTNALYVHQIDIAGNISATSATPDVSFTLSAGNAIALPSIALITDTGHGVIDPNTLLNTGVNTDHLTAQPDLTFTPSNPADTLMYSIDGGAWTSAVVAGAFTLNVNTDPANFGTLSTMGAHTVQAYEIGAGGQSAAATYSFTTDNLGPINNIGGGGTPLSSDFQGLYVSASNATAATAVMRITYNEAVVIDQGNQPILMDPTTGMPWIDPLSTNGSQNGTFTTTIANSGLSWDGSTTLGPQMQIQMDPTGQPMVDPATGLPIMNLVDIVEIRFTESTIGNFAAAGLVSGGNPTAIFVPAAEVLLTDTAGNIPGTLYADWSTANTGFTTWQIHAMP